MTYILYSALIIPDKKKTAFMLLLLIFIPFFVVFTLFLSYLDNFQAFWALIKFLLPIVFIFFWPGIFLILFIRNGYFRFEQKVFLHFLVLLVSLSILGVLGALLFNMRIIYLLMAITISLEGSLVFSADKVVFQLLATSIMVPLVEESFKVLPVIFLGMFTGTYFKSTGITSLDFNVEKEGADKSFSSCYSSRGVIYRSVRIAILYGVISGAIFQFFEIFLYVWVNFGDIPQSAQYLLFLQLLIRIVNPLHILSACIAAFGVGSSIHFMFSLLPSRQKKGKKMVASKFIPYFLVAVALHASWNALTTLLSFFAIFKDFFSYISFLVLVSMLLNIILIFFLRYFRNYAKNSEICNYCPIIGPRHQHNVQKGNFQIQASKTIIDEQGFFVEERQSELHCEFCSAEITSFQSCRACGASIFLICPHCGSLIAPTDRQCATCAIRIRSVLEYAFSPPLRKIDTFFTGFTGITSIVLLSGAVSLLTFRRLQEINTISQITLIIFYLIFGLTGLSGIYLVISQRPYITFGLLICFLYASILIFSLIAMLAIASIRMIFSLRVDSEVIGLIIFFGISYLFRKYVSFFTNLKFTLNSG